MIRKKELLKLIEEERYKELRLKGDRITWKTPELDPLIDKLELDVPLEQLGEFGVRPLRIPGAYVVVSSARSTFLPRYYATTERAAKKLKAVIDAFENLDKLLVKYSKRE